MIVDGNDRHFKKGCILYIDRKFGHEKAVKVIDAEITIQQEVSVKCFVAL